MFAIAIWDAREQEAPALPRPAGHQASLLLLRRPALRVRVRAQGAREGAGASASSRSTPALATTSSATATCRRRRRCTSAASSCRRRTSSCTRRPTGALTAPRRYWSVPVPDEPRTPPLEAACEELRSLIGASVAEQMVADVPLGFFLSGGVDSSVVVAAAAATGTRVATFSIGFDSDEVSETPFAREVAQRFGTDHHERILSQAHAQELLPRLKSWFDEPFADESSMPTYLVCSAAREHVTVVLDGRRRRRGVRRAIGPIRATRVTRAGRPGRAAVETRDLRAAPAVSAPPRRDARAHAARDRVQRRPESLGQAHGRHVDAREARLRARARHSARLRRLVALPRVLARRLAAAHTPAVRRLPHVHARPRADEGRPHEHGRVARSARAAARAAHHRVLIRRCTRTCASTAASRKACCATLTAASCPITFSTAARRASAFRATT